MKAKRKTLNAGDVFAAMEEMEFDRFLGPLQEALDVYKKGKKDVSEQRRKDKGEKNEPEYNKNREDEQEEEEAEHMDDEPNGDVEEEN